MNAQMTTCPGCGLQMLESDAVKKGYYNASAECLSLYADVLGVEFGNVLLFSQVHQLTVDAYALQHAGADHKDKSVAVHLVGLHLAFEQGFRIRDIAPRLQLLASRTSRWPRFEPPDDVGPLTVFDVAMAETDEHAATVRRWAEQLWSAWRPHHAAAAEMASRVCAAT